MLSFQVGVSEAGRRLDHFLQQHMPGYSRARLQEWIKSGRVLINGIAEKPAYVLKCGERVEVEPAELRPLRAAPEPIPLDVLYEDADIVVVNKPAGMVVHAGAGCGSGTLVNALLHRFGQLSARGGDLRPGIVHRLDRYTSGVLVVARNDFAHSRLAEQFASRKVEKTYIALVHGTIAGESGKIDKPITRDPARRIKMTARLGRGRTAVTEYRVLKRFSCYTLLEVRLHTGRTHQIRVHLSSMGHPVVGDRIYGAPSKPHARPPLGRFFLHAFRIRFAHPRTATLMTVEAPLPKELSGWLSDLESGCD
jgi:23S rRNA pseudouridine1911/1915/1917 synthase